ncbi:MULTISPECIES: GNAT family N-acetyltransferase [unclassified Leptolyngbya]|uniref:GNAT family N-acetyltransferase n=1 Tax=unclassified Leptolyngbya TaxID=2650499 RepID=UPI001683AEF5|nr:MULTISPECIES: GNAT family N-acetyltransferase [unclassified Leptolyngbya]MBD1909518.1 GNAT family N-acetyltransferase [Leptolyngbya sp. FACHB-8]MBD2158997.1 GNAT family N-acetyltransferase [Leptolyngbya sp. FACHB-16]
MATLSNFCRQSLSSDTELEAIADLYNLCATVDELDGGTSASELQEDFNDPCFDRDQDLQVWRDRDETLQAVATLWRPISANNREGYLHFFVHPDARGQGLENDILAWAEQRLRLLSTEPSQAVELRMGCRDTFVERIAQYEQFGCSPVRYFFRMRRSLIEPVPEPQLPDGFYIRQVDPEVDAEAWVEMFNQSFIDHWNHHPMTLEEYRYYTSMSNYDASMDFVAVSPDGTLAAFCYAQIDMQENARSGQQEGWINLLGTRRGFRRQGLGRAMLLAGLHRLVAAGMNSALLGVDVDNPNGALGLYRSAGFEEFRRFITFHKRVC